MAARPQFLNRPKGTPMKWLLARLSEPSTWAGIGLFATQVLPAIQTHSTPAILGALVGAIATVTSEQKPA